MAENPQRKPSLTYRRDIDGLRAVAVLLVVFNHLHTRFNGGYIGVDVFFVISGYLISAVIIQEMNRGEFSIVEFYERRIRRIFPALFVMMGVVTVLAWFYLTPSEVEEYARSMLAAVYSGSNLLFWHEAGYFDAPSSLKPLLHTWSLAVEEQFYILFPLVLVLVKRWFPQRLQTAIWTISGISFAAACYWVWKAPTAAFFFAPLRAWELLIGTILSQKYLPRIEGAIGRNIASIAGILLIFVPSLMYSPQTPFPGLAALPPCLGAALLIAAGDSGGSIVGSILSWRPVTFIGLISYSLYLWHWPILVYQTTSSALLDVPQFDKRAKLAVFVVSIIVATLSWRFVETPFRKGKFRPSRRLLAQMTVVSLIILTAAGAVLIGTHGVPSRYPADALAVSQYSDFDPTATFRQGDCFIVYPQFNWTDFKPNTCLADDGNPTRKHDLLLGDSHAAHLYSGLAKEFPEINLSQITHSGCKSVAPDSLDPRADTDDCSPMARFVYGDYLLHHHIDTVLLAGRYTPEDMPALEKTLRWFKQHNQKVIVFGPVMEFDAPLPRILATALRDRKPQELDRHRLNDAQDFDAILAAKVRKEFALPYISAFEDLCHAQVEMEAKSQPETSNGCPLYAAPGIPILFDTDHFTPAGSLLYASIIRTRNQLPH
jgi:peptidoglycan/LPS O-acetylase OafA/YrhL